MDKDYLFGIKPVIEALESRKSLDKILIKKGKNDDNISDIRSLARKLRVPVSFVPQEKLDRITRKNHQGCIALSSPIEFSQVAQVLPNIFEKGEMPLIMILDGITDVRNFGAIARTCLSAGFHAIVIPSSGFARIGADAVKTSAGAILKLDICREDNLARTIEFMQESGVCVYAATEKAEENYYNSDFVSPTAIVLGAEDKGVSTAVMRRVDNIVKIPMSNNFDSLNVSVAAGVLAFEAVKQRLENPE